MKSGFAEGGVGYAHVIAAGGGISRLNALALASPLPVTMIELHAARA